MKPITLLTLLLLMSTVGYAVTISEGTIFSPSTTGGNITASTDFDITSADVSSDRVNMTWESGETSLNVNGSKKSVNTTFLYLPTYNQIFYSNQSNPFLENNENLSINISPKNRSIIIGLSSSTAPKFSSVAKTIKTINYNYTSNVLTINCTGSGSMRLQNLDDIGASLDIYHNGAWVEVITNPTYTMTSCSSWVFKTSSSGVYMSQNALPDIVSAFMSIVSFFPIILLIIIGGLLIGAVYIFKTGNEINFDWDRIGVAMIAVLAGAFVIIIILVILKQMTLI